MRWAGRRCPTSTSSRSPPWTRRSAAIRCRGRASSSRPPICSILSSASCRALRSVRLSPRSRRQGRTGVRIVMRTARTFARSRRALLTIAATMLLPLLARAAVEPAKPAGGGDSPAPNHAVSVKDSPGYVPLVDPESTSVTLGRRTNAPLVRMPFHGGARSLDDLGRAVCRALHRGDRDELMSLSRRRQRVPSHPVARVPAEPSGHRPHLGRCLDDPLCPAPRRRRPCGA